MDTGINIQKVKFEFNMENEVTAFDLYSGWHSFFNSIFLRIVEKVLNKYDKKDVHLIVEKLDLDIGEIVKEDFYARFPVLLEEKLEELMKQLYISDNIEGIKKISESFLLFEAFTYYLIHGFYPWPNSKIKGDFKSIFIKITGEYPNEFREFLFRYGHYTSLRRRLILQLENTGLEELVKVTNSSESSFIITYFNLLINEKTYRKVDADKVKDHRDACWEVILSYLLVSRGSYFNRREFVGQTINELAGHYNIGYAKLLLFLSSAIEGILMESSYRSELKTILSDLARKVSESNHSSENRQAGEIEKIQSLIEGKTKHEGFNAKTFVVMLADETFREKLIRSFSYYQLLKLAELVSGTLQPKNLNFVARSMFHALLERSILKSVDSLTEILKGIQTGETPTSLYLTEARKLLKRPHSRHLLIFKLNENQIHKLLKLMMPRESGFIISYSKTLDNQKERNIFEGKAGGEFKQLKWEFIFAVLFEETQTSFNRKSFVLSVISMLAAHYNLKTYDLLSYLYRAIINNEISVGDDLSIIVKELYFECKAEKAKQQEISFFDKAVREAFYFSLLKEFIKTGVIRNNVFIDKIFDVLSYLENYRHDLLTQLIEELKSGFLPTDISKITHHKEFYRKLILIAIQTYRINLPGGQRVKSLLGNIDEDRYRGVSVQTYKTMLLALLKNDTSLFEKAWDVLTEKANHSILSDTFNLSLMPDEAFLGLIYRSGQPEILDFIQSNRKIFILRIFSSMSIFKGTLECCRMDSRIATYLEKAFEGIPPGTLLKMLSRLFPYEGEPLRFLLLELSKKLPAHSTLKSSIKKLLAENGRTIQVTFPDKNKPSFEKNGFIEWLASHFGTSGEYDLNKYLVQTEVFNPVAFSEFEKLLIGQPELVLQQVLKGILSKHKITQWVKSASASLQLRWLQVLAPPYQKVLIEEAFLLIEWLKTAVGKITGASFPWQQITDLLLDFCSGKLQNIDRNALFKHIFAIVLEKIEAVEQVKIIEEVQLKGANHGQLWGKRVEAILTNIAGEQHTQPEEISLSNNLVDQKQKSEIIDNVLEEIYIDNAGLVICAPYLSRLFNLLGLLTEGEFTNRESCERAVLLLQYMLYRETIFPEHKMVLNKLLCGLTPGSPIVKNIEVSEKENEVMLQMLTGMIQQWTKLGTTSPVGLIESFMKREGKLTQKTDTWLLTIEQKGYDILLDSIPWSFTPIKFRWMKKAIMVKWR